MKIKRWQKKPVVIEALEYIDGTDVVELINFCGASNVVYFAEDERFGIKTLEGTMMISNGDFIIKGVRGECYPCKPDIFFLTYEPASDAVTWEDYKREAHDD